MSKIFVADKLKIQGTKTLSTIALILILTASAIMAAMPAANAHTPPWTIPTYAFLNINPNPVGVGQTVYVNFWIDKVPPTSEAQWGYMWQNMTVTVTKPDGTTTTLGPFSSDAVGGAWTTFTPTATGTYTFVGHFPQQAPYIVNPYPYPHSINLGEVFINDTYLASTSNTMTLTVQQAQRTTIPSNPLPTSYWTRPINSLNREWSSIGGTWLGSPQTFSQGNFSPYTTAPNSAHVVWTKPIAFGGQIGGEFGSLDTSLYATGAAYEPKFGKPIIINGVLYYTLLETASTSPGPLTAVNLRTGQTLWTQNTTALIYGMVYNFKTGDQYGAAAYLFTQYAPGSFLTSQPGNTPTNVWSMYDAMTGSWILNIANVTSGTIVEGPNGELLSYRVAGGMLTMWNSSLCIATGATRYNVFATYSALEIWRPPQGATIDWSGGNQWSVPIATKMSANAISLSISSIDNAVGAILMTQTNTFFGTPDYIADPTLVRVPGSSQLGWRIDAGYSASTGQLLWGPVNRTQIPYTNIRIEAEGQGVYTEYNQQLMTHTGYSILTGQQLWGPTQSYTTSTNNEWGYYYSNSLIGYGNLYAWSMGGAVYCYNLTTGALKWQWNAENAGYNSPYGVYPFFTGGGLLADGKFFIAAGHNYTPPIFKGAKLYAINATTGELVWSMLDFGTDSNNNVFPISDGYMIAYNAYDNQIYAHGLGPSKVTVTAPNVGVTTSAPITISGTVTDISAGSQQEAVAANFPNGLPCISDASMSQWMEYVYEQQPMPTNATGVIVTLDSIDPNNNFVHIGTVTSDLAGTYGYTWTPPIPGLYKIIATFGGSNSYYASYAEAYTSASRPPAAQVPIATPAPATTAQPTVTLLPTATPSPQVTTTPVPAPSNPGVPTTYIIIAIVAVIIVVVAAALALRRRK